MTGMSYDVLQQGEEPTPYTNKGTDEKFGEFEQAIIHAVAWANQIPPAILTLKYEHNYSASQGEINEFKMYLNKYRAKISRNFCVPVYTEWLINETLTRKIKQPTPGFQDSITGAGMLDVFGAWISSDFSGAIKPSTDKKKLVQAYREEIAEGLITNQRAARELNGTKFTDNIKKLEQENKLKVKAARPLAEFKKEFGESPDQTLDTSDSGSANGNIDIEAIAEEVLELNKVNNDE